MFSGLFQNEFMSAIVVTEKKFIPSCWHYECSFGSRSALFLWSDRIVKVMFCTINNNNST